MASERDERINEELLKSSVAKKFGVSEDLVRIEEWSTSGGSADGDNFSCELIAVKGSALVNWKPESFSFMCKVEPTVEMRKQMLKQVHVAFVFGTCPELSVPDGNI